MTAVAGETVSLPCRESLGKEVTWQYQKSPDYLSAYVYYIGEIWPPYLSRFDVNRSTAHQFDLNIPKAKVSDSGKYICNEDGGQGIRHVYQLRVIGILFYF